MIMAPTNDSQQIFTTARDYSIAHVNYATLFWSSLIGCKILKTNQNDLKTNAAEIQTQISLQDLLQVDVQKKYLYCPYWLRSVTRFATISPLCTNLKVLCKCLRVYLAFGKILILPIVAKTFYYWASFHCCRWPQTLK